MSYALDLGPDGDRDPGEAIRAVARDQVDGAIADLDALDASNAVERVHSARKACKKARAAARLVRPSIGSSYGETNTALRDAARALSPYRDAHALLATFDDLIAVTSSQIPSGGVGTVRAELARRARESTRRLDAGHDDVDRARSLLERGRELIDDWTLGGPPGDSLAGGLAKTYGRGRSALVDAIDAPTADAHHELRKRAKYTWYHLRLLEPTAPSSLGPLADVWHDLADGLGDAHDLAVLAAALRGRSDEGAPDGDDGAREIEGGEGRAAWGAPEVVEAALVVVDGRREMLEQRSIALARRLLADDVDCFVGRLVACWEVHRRWGPEHPVGEIAEVFDRSDSADELTVAELRALAGEAGVVGRWSMARDELVAVVRAEGVLG
ncbi:CHAD domain-containing protein [Ilumatobacter sp.]|uniref:CHAD domain-containing protein n=1 Tax=Ilumatobacter sp. TaxID=1967498 RepID=UPI003B52EE00